MQEFEKIDYSIEDLEQFRDKDGFINLSEMDMKINLKSEAFSREKKGTAIRVKNWFDFKGQKALIRGEVVGNYGIYSELIVEEIAKQLGIETAHYDLVKFKNSEGKMEQGVLSVAILDFDKEYLVSLHDLIGDEKMSSDFEITSYQFTIDKLKERLKIAKYRPIEINKIIRDYKKRLLFYITILETDKHPENISFIKPKNGGKIRISPNYDSEFALMLENEKDIVEAYSENPFEAGRMSKTHNPKIGVEEGYWDLVWLDTVEELIEDDEIYDYYNDCLRGKIDFDKVFESVENRIHSKLPQSVKNTATSAYEFRNLSLDRLIDGKLTYKDVHGKTKEEREEEGQKEKIEADNYIARFLKMLEESTTSSDVMKVRNVIEENIVEKKDKDKKYEDNNDTEGRF